MNLNGYEIEDWWKQVRDHGWGPRMKTWRVLKYRVKTLTGSGTKWSTLNPMVSNYKISKDLKRYKKDLKGTCDLRREFKKQFELFMAAVRHQMTDRRTDRHPIKVPRWTPVQLLAFFTTRISEFKIYRFRYDLILNRSDLIFYIQIFNRWIDWKKQAGKGSWTSRNQG